MSRDPLVEGKSIADQVAAFGGAGRGGGTRRLAEARAEVSGKSVAAEMRAVQRALKAGKPPAKQAPEVAKAGAAHAAANQLRNARKIKAGNVKVNYPTRGGGYRSEGSRDLGDFTVTGDLQDAVRDAADMLEEGDVDGALDRISEALLDEYGDLGGTLEITDFLNGLKFE
ncbi:hypothetical protein [Micromonospora zamorensis]|uniref:hypothetical protein n=1 Tax=Micromonospora zamorensis TaxID=709883 RepID=UPI003CEA0471